jgi:hypothetical protein
VAETSEADMCYAVLRVKNNGIHGLASQPIQDLCRVRANAGVYCYISEIIYSLNDMGNQVLSLALHLLFAQAVYTGTKKRWSSVYVFQCPSNNGKGGICKKNQFVANRKLRVFVVKCKSRKYATNEK